MDQKTQEHDIAAEMEFYKRSLNMADREIERRVIEEEKALKDVVGAAFENHRKRIWEYFGFTVTKDRFGAMFDVDWSITYNGRLIAFEEDKGHYVDSCFAERAISGFAKTINKFLKNNEEIPTLILHSFTRYNKFNVKLNEDMETRKNTIVDQINKKLVYNTLVSRDRISKNRWFSRRQNRFNCYSLNVEDELIVKDIMFIKSLIPVSQ